MSNLSTKEIFQSLKKISNIFPNKNWVIAYSGGIDSTVLLHAACQISKKIRAIHIDHRFNENSKLWAKHCINFARKLKILCNSYKLQNYKILGCKNQEIFGRKERYRIFAKKIQSNEILLMAHQLNDQAETIFLNLMRGSGILGISGIPIKRNLGNSLLYRPFLNIEKYKIQEYAKIKKLSWIEDPSNKNIHFNRNYVRNVILPHFLKRWPNTLFAINQSSKYCRDSYLLIQSHINSLIKNKNKNLSSLSITWIQTFSKIYQDSIIRIWFSSVTNTVLPRKSLKHIYLNILQAKKDSNPLLKIGKWNIRRYKKYIYIVKYTKTSSNINYCIPWNGKNGIKIPGLSIMLFSNDISHLIDCKKLKWSNVSIRNRINVKNSLNIKSKKLKKIYQKMSIPPWERDTTPLLFENKQLKIAISIKK